MNGTKEPYCSGGAAYSDTLEAKYYDTMGKFGCYCAQWMLGQNPALMEQCKCNNCEEVDGCPCDPWTHKFNDSSNNGTWFHYAKYDYINCFA